AVIRWRWFLTAWCHPNREAPVARPRADARPHGSSQHRARCRPVAGCQGNRAMIHFLRRGVRLRGGLLLLAPVAGRGRGAGCGPADGVSGSQPGGGGPTPVTLQDPTPDQLDVDIYLAMGTYAAQTRDTTGLGVTDRVLRNNLMVPVRVTGTPTFDCNGKAL